ncbi:alpha/beta fold hydrolase [Rubinisphaera italica]|uniref:3-oxoadipate enol-lactonase 2 n=1 Tax=Rubinisphaera italica TaxID=2527969 RepID=A0A5C5XKV0_9PLAN|nr:alpha/beta hydrolase [Rubinisphaera italica]TWT62765.1 3-oxoadipate enol-lactonase 2 [Rubinisphaera italica]
MELTIRNTTYHVEDRGTGAPLLFVHGFPLDHTMWSAQLNAFAERYRVIAPDLHGFGMSTGVRELSGMEDFADDLQEILAALSITEPVTLCGLSMGGYIAWQFAQKYPERLSRLIVCDTKATADTEPTRANRLELAERVLKEGPEFFVDGMLQKLFSAATIQTNSPVVEQTRNVILKTDPQAIAAAALGMAARPDMSSTLSAITVPTLVICGAEDQITTVLDMQKIAEQIPNAQFEVILGAGHMAPMEKPADVNDIITYFLAGTDI